MKNSYLQELSPDEIDHVSGGVPIPLIIAGGIFLAGVVVGAYNGYKEAGKENQKQVRTGRTA